MVAQATVTATNEQTSLTWRTATNAGGELTESVTVTAIVQFNARRTF